MSETLKKALKLIEEADDLLYSLEIQELIGDDIRTNIIEVIDEIEDLLGSDKE